MSGVFDSNVDHDERDLDSRGAMLSARVTFRSRRFSLQYQAGVDRFSRTDRWDRVTHRVRADVRQRITPRWRANTLAEVSVGHSSDDREVLGNHYTLVPELEHRFDDARRLSVYGAYRFRRVGDHAERNDTTWYGGAEFRHDAGGTQSWAAGYRYEASAAPVARRSYTRHAYVTDYRVKATSRDELLAGVTFRPRQYPHRLFELPTGTVPRRDRRWTPRLAWIRSLSHGLRMDVMYTFDGQTSNEPSKNFQAHRVAYTVRWSVR